VVVWNATKNNLLEELCMSNERVKFLKLEYLRKKYGIKSQKDMALLINKCLSAYNHKVLGITPWMYDEMIIIHKELNERAKKMGHGAISISEIFFEDDQN
jgi:hypothetical protein